MSTRFSSADTAWLHMDRPTNLMVINSVLLFDEPVDWERLKQVTQRRMVDRYPRFRQRVVESRLPLLPPTSGRTIRTSPSSITCITWRCRRPATAERCRNSSAT